MTTNSVQLDTAHPGNPRHLRGSARMFRSEFIEKFSHVHPATPFLLYAPVVGYCLWRASRVVGQEDAFSAGGLMGLFVVGYVSWTLFEYWFHRLFFHLRVIGPRTQRLYFFIHGVHHDWPWDTSRLVMPPGVSLPLAVAMFFLSSRVLGPQMMWPVLAGFVAGYIIYDTVHWWSHAGRADTRFGKWVKREHMVHHFKDSHSRFGVSCPWLDHVFGTTGTRGRTGDRIPSPEDAEITA